MRIPSCFTKRKKKSVVGEQYYYLINDGVVKLYTANSINSIAPKSSPPQNHTHTHTYKQQNPNANLNLMIRKQTYLFRRYFNKGAYLTYINLT